MLTGNEGVVGIVERREVCHLRRAAIGVLSVRKELIDCIECVRLDGIIGSEYDELGCVGLH